MKLLTATDLTPRPERSGRFASLVWVVAALLVVSGCGDKLGGKTCPDTHRRQGEACAGLRSTYDSAAKFGRERLGIYAFDEHVELAEWRTFEWLLDEADQGEALIPFWREYLGFLSRAGVPRAIEEFVRITGSPAERR